MNYYFMVFCVLTFNYVSESEAFFARRLFLRKNINPIVYKDVTFQAPVFPTFQWNKNWGVNQPVSTQSASFLSSPEQTASVSSYSAPAASYSAQFPQIFPTNFHWNKSWGVNQPASTQTARAPAPIASVPSYATPIAYKYLTFNQPPQIENKINTEPAPASYSRQAPVFNWNYNKNWGVNPAPAVAHQSAANFEIKPVTFTIPSISIPIPTLNWNFNKNWGTNQVQGIQSKTNFEEEEVPIQSKTNVEEEEEVPIQNPKPRAETFEKTVDAQNVYKPLVASKKIDINLSLG